MIGRGRVISAVAAAAATKVAGSAAPTTAATPVRAARVVSRAIVDASDEATRIVSQASARAREILEKAERQAAEVKLRAETEARAEAVAKLASHALSLASHEAKADERALDRSIALARLLAERLLGAQLAVAPEQIALLAKQALSEARGARRVSIVAHPDDAKLLEGTLPTLGIADVVKVVASDARKRGSLRIETDIGVLDADLAPQLDRLALRLRETLAHGR
jgi:flagellar biosynthesis/type III secretory pathway protein FliH